MNKNKSQKALNITIVLLVIALAVMIGIVIYDTNNAEKNIDVAKTEMNQNQNNETIKEEIKEEEKEETQKENNDEYIGEEEKNSQEGEDIELTNEEKALQLAKEKWGENDNTVTYSIEEKNGNIYYIAVKSDAKTVLWYEVNIETWEISEFY